MSTNISATERKETIARVYREMRQDVFAIFRQACIPEADCEDLIQDVFVKLLAIDTLRVDTIDSIVATIAHHLRIDFLRKKSFQRKTHRHILSANIFDTLFEDVRLSTDEIAHIEQCIIDAMPETNRKIYCMTRFEGQSQFQIAQTLGMSYRAVESRLYRSRMEVRQQLKRAVGM